MQDVVPVLENSWFEVLNAEFQKYYFLKLERFLEKELEKEQVFPPQNLWFEAFRLTPFKNVKVVILGQDPYHGPGQAHGLSFSVPHGVKIPPSLRNIFKELADDLKSGIPLTNNLSNWAEQGVLLLNATLTVRAKSPGSHQKQGWEEFTDAVIQTLSGLKENLVFVLWGSYAQQKGAMIDRTKHLIIESAHPSPFSAHRGFLGSQPFSKTNSFLEEKGQVPIDWSL